LLPFRKSTGWWQLQNTAYKNVNTIFNESIYQWNLYVLFWRLWCKEEPSAHSYHETNKNNPILTSHFFKHWLLHYPPKWFLMFRCSKQNLYSLLLYYMHATCHIYMYYLPCCDYVNYIWWRVADMKLTTVFSAPLYSYFPLTSNIPLTTPHFQPSICVILLT